MNVVPRTPAEHYAMAETLLAQSIEAGKDTHQAAFTLSARAQVHATLAAVPLAVAEFAHVEWEAEDIALENRELARITDQLQALEGALKMTFPVMTAPLTLAEILNEILTGGDMPRFDAFMHLTRPEPVSP